MSEPPSSPLQRRLAGEILAYARSEGLPAGQALTEQALCARFGVSRTPVRAALLQLAEEGHVERRGKRGFRLARAGSELPAPAGPPPDEAEALYTAILRDRVQALLPDQVSEADLQRRFGVSRALLRRVLTQLAGEGLVARNPGYRWSFRPTLDNAAVQAESYRLRLLLEPAGLLEPSFRLDAGLLARLREAHERVLSQDSAASSPQAFFEMNAAFHEALARFSGNRFILQAIEQQNRLRRMSEYAAQTEPERMAVSCREHLEIMAALLADDRELAASLLRSHLLVAATL